MPESTIQVLRDDCPCAENLVGDLGEEFILKEKLHFFFRVDTFIERKKSNPCGLSLSQKFFFSCFFLQVAAKSSTLPHVSLTAKMRTKSTRALSFSSILGSTYFAGQNDQLRLKSSQTALKAFQMIFQ